MNEINRLSDFIDKLNAEEKPEENEYNTDSPELRELMRTVRLVRTLKEPAEPSENFRKRLSENFSKELRKEKRTSWKNWTLAASVFAIVALVFLTFTVINEKTNMVAAMEKAFREVDSYYGILEVLQTNEEGETTLQSKLEVWATNDGQYYVHGLDGIFKGMTTVNNGEEKWQINHEEKEVRTFAAYPDPYRFTFEIGNEIEDLKKALSYKTIGKATIAGRKATIIEVTPKAGEPYKIWVDEETQLPLQKQTAMQYGLQYTVRFTEIDFSKTMPKDLLTYKVPEGYEEKADYQELVIQDTQEAVEMVDQPILVPDDTELFKNDRISVLASEKIVKMYFVNHEDPLLFIQGKTEDFFKPSSMAILAKVNGKPAEIQAPISEAVGIVAKSGLSSVSAEASSIRWQEDSVEYALIGNLSIEEFQKFISENMDRTLELPDQSVIEPLKPQIIVPYDMETEENTQKGVDAGHSPWRLDPVYVAQVFVRLEILPGGITGNYPIPYDDFTVVYNDGKTSVIEVDNESSPVKRVYLQRVVLQDPTGIWTVIGYDPA